MHLDWQLNLHQQHPFWPEPPRKRRLNMCRSLARMCSVPPQSTSALNSTRQRLRTAMLGCWARWSQIGFRRPPPSGSRARVDCRGPCRPVGQKTIGQERQCPRMCIATSLPQTLCHCFPMPRAPAMLFDGDCCQNFLTEIAKWLLKGLNHLLKNSWSTILEPEQWYFWCNGLCNGGKKKWGKVGDNPGKFFPNPGSGCSATSHLHLKGPAIPTVTVGHHPSPMPLGIMDLYKGNDMDFLVGETDRACYGGGRYAEGDTAFPTKMLRRISSDLIRIAGSPQANVMASNSSKKNCPT